MQSLALLYRYSCVNFSFSIFVLAPKKNKLLGVPDSEVGIKPQYAMESVTTGEFFSNNLDQPGGNVEFRKPMCPKPLQLKPDLLESFLGTSYFENFNFYVEVVFKGVGLLPKLNIKRLKNQKLL